MDETENFQDKNKTDESEKDNTNEENTLPTVELFETNKNMEDKEVIFSDRGLGDSQVWQTEFQIDPSTNIPDSVDLSTDLITESGIEVSKDSGVIIPTSKVLNFSEDNTKVSDVEKDIISDLISFVVNETAESGIISEEFSLHEEFMGEGFQVTDTRSSDELGALRDTPRFVHPFNELEEKSSPNQCTEAFSDVIQPVQNIVVERDENIREEISSPHQSARSKFEAIPSDSTLSDIEMIRECCTRQETKPMQQENVPIRQDKTGQPENLDPDNPLMRRFQIALNAHLQRQKSRIAEELLEMEGNMRQRKKETDDLSTFLHTTQQALSRQHKSLDKDKGKLMKYFNQRQDTEELLKSEKKKHKQMFNMLQFEQKKQTNFQLEKDNLNAMINQFTQWEASMSSELTISQLISDKNKADKKLFTQEKMKQDILLVNLSTEVLRLSTMFSEMEKNIKDKQADLKLLTTAVMDGSVDLEALEHENKRLMQLWKVVIYRIQQRDNAYNDLKSELLQAKDQFRGLMCQIESYKRSASSEIKCNENLTHTLTRLEFDVETLERQRSVEEDKQRKLREMLVQAEDMIDYTQRDLDFVMAEYKVKEKEMSQLQRHIDKVMLSKYTYEDRILNLLQRQLCNTKAESQANKRIKQLHQDCRQQEVFKSSVENDLAKTLLQIEHESKAIKERQIMLDEEKILEHERDVEIKSMELDYARLDRNIGAKQTRVDNINMKVAEILAKSGDTELSPEELHIKQLEKHISECNNTIKDLQILWMREQNHIVTLKQQRTNQLHQLNIYRKQVLILDHKYLKLDQEIEKYRKDESNMNRGIHTLEQKLEALNQQCSQRRGYKDMLDNDNDVAQNQLICDLKDAEVASIRILEEMCQLEVDKEELRKQLMDTQREMLAWEKKEKLAAETKQNMEKAKSEGGEIAVMKSEIHRMEVRCVQLHKVQEKLAQDMEMCVSRRDGIVDLAYAREKRTAKGAHYTRQQFMRKLDDLRNKLRHVNSELKSVDKAIAASEARLKDLKARVDVEKQQVIGLQEAVANMEADLHDGNLHWQKNLELLVRRQRKAKLYGDVKSGRYVMMIKTESGLELETLKQRTVNSDLISVVESLNSDFPSLKNPLAQILNTLRSPAA